MDAEHITRLLNEDDWDLDAGELRQMDEVYQQLKRIARIQRVKVRVDGFNTTALVNEAWLKSQNARSAFKDRSHFYAYCALAMRHILLNQARRHKLVTYVDDDRALDRQPVYQQSEYLLELERMLQSLREYSARLERVFTFKFFGDMTFTDIATVLEISERTAKRDFKKAQAMLAAAMEA